VREDRRPKIAPRGEPHSGEDYAYPRCNDYSCRTLDCVWQAERCCLENHGQPQSGPTATGDRPEAIEKKTT
jgi:hypothetical protein